MSHVAFFDYANASAEARAAFDAEEELRGSVTNMKRTLLHSPPALNAYLSWYSLRDEVLPIIGSRAFIVFSHAISTENDCLLCSTFFRHALSNAGLSPDSFSPEGDEPLLIDFGRAIVRRSSAIPAELWTRIKARFSEAEIVKLVAFAGLMIATNVFNNTLDVPVDNHLLGYVKS